jgi:aryl-alcohol dehydrogenase-like predicted oxidoreductase
MIRLTDRTAIPTAPTRVWCWFVALDAHYRDWHTEHLTWRTIRGTPLTEGAIIFVDQWLGRYRFTGRCRIAAVQPEYSMWSRDVEAEILPTCRQLGIALVPYSPLGRGFLTGAIRSAEQLDDGDRRRIHPRFQGENLDHNLALADSLAALAEEWSYKPAQLALAWLLDQGNDIVPIPGTRSITRLDENALAARIHFDDGRRERIAALLERHAIAGTRYPSAQMGSVNV